MIEYRKVPNLRDTLIERGFDLTELENHARVFFITGSYYFGNDTPFSDLDLFVDKFDGNSLSNCTLLSNSTYLDCLTQEVWRIGGRKHIDIQVSKPGCFWTKEKISSVMKKHGLIEYNKRRVRRLWNAMAACMGVKNVGICDVKKGVHQSKSICPICGSAGDDLGGFAFYCTNRSCSNFRP